MKPLNAIIESPESINDSLKSINNSPKSINNSLKSINNSPKWIIKLKSSKIEPSAYFKPSTYFKPSAYFKTWAGFLLASIILFGSFFAPTTANACSSAIFSGKVTADGRPIIWKHRDTGQRNNRVEKYKGEKYNFIAIVNSNTKGKSIWSGTNDAGFSIMNTLSYNLNENKDFKRNNVGYVMYQALSKCATLLEFEQLLDQFNPLALEANIGVIDAQGGAAYYECSESGWIKFDVNDPKIAPLGYLEYTNHSFTGKFEQGMGYIRYNTAISIINEALNTGKKITPEWVASNLSRSFRHSLLGIDLTQLFAKELEEKSGNTSTHKDNSSTWSNNSSTWSGYFIDQDFIPRLSSTAVTIVQGVKPGENPELTVMYTILGYAPLGIAIPLMVNQELPTFMIASKGNENATMCDIVLAVKSKEIFNITRGNGQLYFNFKVLYNNYMKQIAPVEQELFSEFNVLLDNWRNNNKTANSNASKNKLTSIYTKAYTQFSEILTN